MSLSYGLRALGDPYFAVMQDDLLSMAAPTAPRENDPGSFAIFLVFSLDRLPPKLSSDDELHPLVAYSDLGPSGSDLVSLGVSPNGRIIAKVTNAAAIQSGPGLVVADGKPRLAFIECSFNAGAGLDLMEFHDGPEQSDAQLFRQQAARSRTAIAPATAGRTILFNGVKSTGRTFGTIWSARFLTMSDPDSNPVLWEYDIDENHGPTLRFSKPAEMEPADYPREYNFDLTAHWAVPRDFPQLWGDPSTLPVATAYRWHRRTRYTRVTRPKTVYARLT